MWQNTAKSDHSETGNYVSIDSPQDQPEKAWVKGRQRSDSQTSLDSPVYVSLDSPQDPSKAWPQPKPSSQHSQSSSSLDTVIYHSLEWPKPGDPFCLKQPPPRKFSESTIDANTRMYYSLERPKEAPVQQMWECARNTSESSLDTAIYHSLERPDKKKMNKIFEDARATSESSIDLEVFLDKDEKKAEAKKTWEQARSTSASSSDTATYFSMENSEADLSLSTPDGIKKLEDEVRRLSMQLDQKRAKLIAAKFERDKVLKAEALAAVNDSASASASASAGASASASTSSVTTNTEPKLDNRDIARYSRQLILPEIGPKGQKKLLAASVLIVGAGGLGCPCCLYLSAAGIGKLGLVDFDSVEVSNIQRQILHTESRVGANKALSCALGSSALNSRTKFVIHALALNSLNAMEIISDYDVIVDCSDNVATRYLLNDACVLAKKALVSGSALRFEGQLTIYNHNGGPCYRCIYPKPPPPEAVTNCSDGGVLGAITGVIGSLQALETIKLICQLPDTLAQKLLLFDGSCCSFRSIRLRARKPECAVCGDNPSIKELIDYEQFCGSGAMDKAQNLRLLDPEDRISVKQYKKILDDNVDHLLLDVRMRVETEICQYPSKKQLNIPIDDFNVSGTLEKIENFIKGNNQLPLYVGCHRGNDSQKIVQFLRKWENFQSTFKGHVSDIKGGLESWAKHIDPEFPRY